MTPSYSNLNTELLSTRGTHQVDLPALIKQIRVCRSTLGAVLEELETDEISAGSLETVVECSTAAMVEIEGLWETIKTIAKR